MHHRTYRIVYTGIFAVLLAVCSWISIPTVIPFTLQTFAVFLTVLLLGGKQGTISIFIYLLLGAVGIPVFSNFGAGLGYLFGISADICRELGESGIAKSLEVVGRVEIIAVAVPFWKKIIETGVELIG